MKTTNWRLAFAALIAALSTLGLASCAQDEDPEDPATSEVEPDIDDGTADDPMDEPTDEDSPGTDMNDEGPLDDATDGPMEDSPDDPMDDSTDDSTDAPTTP